MTIAEYEQLYRQARVRFPKLTMEAMRKLSDVYQQAAEKVAAIILNTDLKNLSELTSGAWRQIQSQLERESSAIREAVKNAAEFSVESGGALITNIDEAYMFDLIDKANGRITETGIVNMFAGVNRKLMASLSNRIYQDGYTFAKRIWRIADGYGDDIKNLITTSLSMDRDVIDIAGDLKTYVKLGRRGLAKRYGGLIKGSVEWTRRIRKDVDYSALRLVRSELYQSLQDASRLSGRMNPGCSGLFSWKRNTSEDWNCDCPDLEAGGPYAEEDIPDFPHPNCLCQVIPQLRDGNDFAVDVKAWGRGGDVGYLDEWYDKYYATV